MPTNAPPLGSPGGLSVTAPRSGGNGIGNTTMPPGYAENLASRAGGIAQVNAPVGGAVPPLPVAPRPPAGVVFGNAPVPTPGPAAPPALVGGATPAPGAGQNYANRTGDIATNNAILPGSPAPFRGVAPPPAGPVNVGGAPGLPPPPVNVGAQRPPPAALPPTPAQVFGQAPRAATPGVAPARPPPMLTSPGAAAGGGTAPPRAPIINAPTYHPPIPSLHRPDVVQPRTPFPDLVTAGKDYWATHNPSQPSRPLPAMPPPTPGLDYGAPVSGGDIAPFRVGPAQVFGAPQGGRFPSVESLPPPYDPSKAASDLATQMAEGRARAEYDPSKAASDAAALQAASRAKYEAEHANDDPASVAGAAASAGAYYGG